VVFMPTDQASELCGGGAGPAKDPYIKRVIGLPGERVRVQDGKVWIGDRPLPEPYANPPTYTLSLKTVPPGSYFLLGDNRDNSCDGHIWGFIPEANFIGKATSRFYPFERSGDLTPPDYGAGF
jgi:signal peptidase I